LSGEGITATGLSRQVVAVLNRATRSDLEHDADKRNQTDTKVGWADSTGESGG